jgi:FMN reductase [NAD(P)H]
MTYCAAEQEAIGLCVCLEAIGDMANHALLTLRDVSAYGTTPIGGIRRDPQAMIDLLKLPLRTYPIVGSTIGVPDPAKRPLVKPRVPLNSFALDEVYSHEKVAAGIRDYDVTLRQWWDGQGMAQMPSYIESTAGFYKLVYYPKIAETLRRQGFEFGDSV